MGAKIRVMQVLAICCVCNMPFHAVGVDGGESPDDSTREAVTMELTGLEVGESSLVLSYTITNGADHDVWVCSKASSIPFEMFLTHDGQALLVRKRLDVPSRNRWRAPPFPGTYTRLAPGDDLPDALVIDLPAAAQFVYASMVPEVVACTVRRLVLEIGYYDEDLPALIHGIFAVADMSGLTSRDVPSHILNTYFRGLKVRGVLGAFDDINKDPYGEGHVHISYSYQALTGEKTLRMEISGIAIPYNGLIESDEVSPED